MAWKQGTAGQAASISGNFSETYLIPRYRNRLFHQKSAQDHSIEGNPLLRQAFPSWAEPHKGVRPSPGLG